MRSLAKLPRAWVIDSRMGREPTSPVEKLSYARPEAAEACHPIDLLIRLDTDERSVPLASTSTAAAVITPRTRVPTTCRPAPQRGGQSEHPQ
jgi:hypothetical protein